MRVRLVLASGSPRRQELMAVLGLPFIVAAAEVDEQQRPGEPPAALVQRLSQAKAMAVACRHPNAVIVGADTVVVLDGEVLGKPADAGDAVRMLRALRGRLHLVYSAVTALHVATGRQATELSESCVWMRDYSDEEIAAYVASGDPLDKAGAYAIQHQGFAPVARIEGCHAGVMGLPLGHLARALAAVGVSVPVDVAQACASATGAACCLSDARPNVRHCPR
ncbi:MAG: Maf family protein [Anaerolineae bacterium]|nr:Maf family protein [Anaerolineae bacterium]